MIVTKQCLPISMFLLLCVLTRHKLAKAQYQGGYNFANNYGSKGPAYSGGYGGYGGYGSDAQASEEVDERPKVQLGIRLKIPAIKFELPRMNLPKITVSAKIRQPDGPRVISLPEINLDTSSKVAPPGASGPSNNYAMQDYYGAQRPHQAQENVQTFSFSTQGDDQANRQPSRNHYGHQYGGSYHRGSNYSPTNRQPFYWAAQNSYQQYNNYNNGRARVPAETSYSNNDADLGFNSPVYVTPGPQNNQHYAENRPMRSYQPANNIGNLYVESGSRFKRNHNATTVRH